MPGAFAPPAGAVKKLDNDALSAQTPDSTVAGGNARGIRAIDFQQLRQSPEAVAAGEESIVFAGNNNLIATGATRAIVGGTNNSASGYDAIVIGASNTGESTAVVLGRIQNAGWGSAVIAGERNNAYGSTSGILSGTYNSIPANVQMATILGGNYNEANAWYSVATGTRAVARTYRQHAVAIEAGRQRSDYLQTVQTTNATGTRLTQAVSIVGAPHETQIALPAGTAYAFRAMLIAKATNGDTAAWEYFGVIRNQAGATSLVGTPTINSLGSDTAAGGWTVGITADDTTDTLSVVVTGDATHTINWLAHTHTVEVAA